MIDQDQKQSTLASSSFFSNENIEKKEQVEDTSFFIENIKKNQNKSSFNSIEKISGVAADLASPNKTEDIKENKIEETPKKEQSIDLPKTNTPNIEQSKNNKLNNSLTQKTNTILIDTNKEDINLSSTKQEELNQVSETNLIKQTNIGTNTLKQPEATIGIQDLITPVNNKDISLASPPVHEKNVVYPSSNYNMKNNLIEPKETSIVTMDSGSNLFNDALATRTKKLTAQDINTSATYNPLEMQESPKITMMTKISYIDSLISLYKGPPIWRLKFG